MHRRSRLKCKSTTFAIRMILVNGARSRQGFFACWIRSLCDERPLSAMQYVPLGSTSARCRSINGGPRRLFDVGPGSASFGRSSTSPCGLSSVGSAPGSGPSSSILHLTPMFGRVIGRYTTSEFAPPSTCLLDCAEGHPFGGLTDRFEDSRSTIYAPSVRPPSSRFICSSISRSQRTIEHVRGGRRKKALVVGYNDEVSHRANSRPLCRIS
jgi:hypothetical protein